MSSIPNSAMPHAIAAEPEPEEAPTFAQRAVDLVRENPKTAIAAGAAVIAGAAAAAAIPLARSRRGNGGKAPKKKAKTSG